MKCLTLIFLCCCLFSQLIFAVPTESREWTASSGQKMTGVALRYQDGKIVFKRSNGRIVRVPLDKLSGTDQKILIEHFGIDTDIPDDDGLDDADDSEPKSTTKPSGSGAAEATGLAQPQGKVVGPIATPEGSKYYLYLPKSMKEGRKAPLLFYTDAQGGNPRLINELAEGAELLGWALAISVESKNKSSIKSNLEHCKNSMKHIFATYPVDQKRIYYTGNSGGGAMASFNTALFKAQGVMPNISYIPNSIEPKTKDMYVIGGGFDYNRYTSASARARYGKNGFHRFFPGGHAWAPASYRIDGMIWFQARYLSKNRTKHKEEVKDFEASMLEWLENKKATESHRAYSTAMVLTKNYKPSSATAKSLQSFIKELATDQKNVQYHEALLALDKLSLSYVSKHGTASKKHFDDPQLRSKAERLKKKYAEAPEIDKVLDALCKKTDA